MPVVGKLLLTLFLFPPKFPCDLINRRVFNVWQRRPRSISQTPAGAAVPLLAAQEDFAPSRYVASNTAEDWLGNEELW